MRVALLGAGSIGKRAAAARKGEVMKTINRADYVIQSQIPFGQFLDEYTVRHVRKLAASTAKAERDSRRFRDDLRRWAALGVKEARRQRKHHREIEMYLTRLAAAQRTPWIHSAPPAHIAKTVENSPDHLITLNRHSIAFPRTM